jgi:hypothetical protein
MKTLSRNKIVIFGPYKTGITAIFYKIARSIPCKTRSLFESMEYVEEPEDEHQWVLAKTILWYDDGGNQPKYETFLDFDKQIYLTRDPRDWLVSATLFIIQQEPSLYSDDYKLQRILNALHQKQINPASIPLRHLIELINELSSQHSSTQQ